MELTWWYIISHKCNGSLQCRPFWWGFWWFSSFECLALFWICLQTGRIGARMRCENVGGGGGWGRKTNCFPDSIWRPEQPMGISTCPHQNPPALQASTMALCCLQSGVIFLIFWKFLSMISIACVHRLDFKRNGFMGRLNCWHSLFLNFTKTQNRDDECSLRDFLPCEEISREFQLELYKNKNFHFCERCISPT